MKKYTHQILGIILFILIMYSCSYKHVLIKGKENQIILGHPNGPVKVRYFYNKDTLIMANKDTLLVKNAYKLNYKAALYEQGWREKWTLKRINKFYYKYCSKISKK